MNNLFTNNNNAKSPLEKLLGKGFAMQMIRGGVFNSQCVHGSKINTHNKVSCTVRFSKQYSRKTNQ